LLEQALDIMTLRMIKYDNAIVTTDRDKIAPKATGKAVFGVLGG